MSAMVGTGVECGVGRPVALISLASVGFRKNTALIAMHDLWWKEAQGCDGAELGANSSSSGSLTFV